MEIFVRTLIFLRLQVPHPVLTFACVLLDVLSAALAAGDGVELWGVPADALCVSPVAGRLDSLSLIKLGLANAGKQSPRRFVSSYRIDHRG